MDSLYYPSLMSPFSSDESRIRRRCMGGQRRRVVILTWDHNVFRRYWLLRKYLPVVAQTDADLAVPITMLTSLLGDPTIVPVPVPHDCVDGFGGAYWRRPHAYLDPTVQAGMSMFSLTPKRACLLPPVKRATVETCLSCGHFATDATHLDELLDQRTKTLTLIDLRRSQYRHRTGRELTDDNVWIHERRREIASLDAIIERLCRSRHRGRR